MYMKLNYFDLLSPNPIQAPNAGGILSPTLRSISSVGYNTYQHYLSVILTHPAFCGTADGGEDTFFLLSEQEKLNCIFEMLAANEPYAALLQKALNFFFRETVTYAPGYQGFSVQSDNRLIGLVTKENYPEVCDVIRQRNHIEIPQKEDLSKVKSKKAMEIVKKLQAGRKEKSTHTQPNLNMELGNIISAVANKSLSLNPLNIWDLTIYQLWDSFARISNNNIYDMQLLSTAVWGDKDHHFDAAMWFKKPPSAGYD